MFNMQSQMRDRIEGKETTVGAGGQVQRAGDH